MGTATTRITAEDFVTPPELRAWRLAANGAGRIGGARLQLVSHPTGTRLGACYQQVPLRVLPPFSLAPDEPALLYVLNPTAGLMDGDGQLVHMVAESGTRTVVVGQSATRVHPCLRGFAAQRWQLRVAGGAVLVVLPGPMIPFHRCRYAQQVTIDLEPDAALIWGDVWLAGRYARGEASEQFQFETLVQELLVRRSGRLVFRDRFCWRGPWERGTAAWHVGWDPARAGHPNLAWGSLFVTGFPKVTAQDELGAGQWARFSTAAGDTCWRWQGDSQTVIQRVVTVALQSAAALASHGEAAASPCCLHQDDEPPKPWLLAAHDLAPNHWFSVCQGT
jgi:urease accessory protein